VGKSAERLSKASTGKGIRTTKSGLLVMGLVRNQLPSPAVQGKRTNLYLPTRICEFKQASRVSLRGVKLGTRTQSEPKGTLVLKRRVNG